jgi:hypothetical protein
MSDSDDEDIFNDEADLTILRQMYTSDKAKESESKKEHARILNSVPIFLSSLPKSISYAIQGGRAVMAWLDPENKSLTQEEKKHIKSIDWDIVVDMSQEEAKEFTRFMKSQLEKQLKIKLVIRDENILVRNLGEKVYTYQIGIPEMQSDDWFVDIHPQKIDKNDVIEIQGLLYFKLKVLMDQIEKVNNPQKLTRRFVKYQVMKRALQDMSLFNRKMYEKIKADCLNKNTETITGFNLNCKDIK